MNSNTIGASFAKRNESRYADNLKIVYDLLDTVSHDVKTTMSDFHDLSERSRDNGKALEDLMVEIRGVREDDGVSKKLTGLAQLERLEKLDQLERLDSLDRMQSELKSTLALITASLKNEGSHDAELLQQHTDALGTVRDDLAAWKSKQTKTLEELNELRGLLTEASKSRLKDNDTHVSALCKIQDAQASIAADLGRLRDAQADQAQQGTKQLDSVCARLETLAQAPPQASNDELLHAMHGDVRAVLDHLLGIHKQTLVEIEELRTLKADTDARAGAQADAQAAARHEEFERAQAEQLRAEVAQLKKEQRQLQEHCGALKAELSHGVQQLRDCEDRYMRLETQLREMTMSKYKGILGTSALAVLSNNPKSELVVKKRQLRTVSLADN